MNNLLVGGTDPCASNTPLRESDNHEKTRRTRARTEEKQLNRGGPERERKDATERNPRRKKRRQPRETERRSKSDKKPNDMRMTGFR
ncbi:hypothetical protein LIPSTDRAFT_68672 [Lipomyces starkeyi NRRL Y-11557]|uniref:Uncharacterized protein n=1 Tax=Lipomyces starkeyi NRRL Y-11557 TaxID=675824 RepID=A0A1E3QEC9_LIPST|nr:hypothetical protein LIPSTDRAFT_68672 [Lipomyces starkeyi NRRL Y-11557]